MKPDYSKPVTIASLKTGDIFTLTKGGVYLQKIKKPDRKLKRLCFARICGDTGIQSFTENFLVYFIKHTYHAKLAAKKPRRRFVQMVIPYSALK